MQKGERVTLFRLSQPTSVLTVIKRCKNLIVLDNSTRWNNDGTPQNDEQSDFTIKPWTEDHQSFLNERVLATSVHKIQRTMRVKRVLKSALVLDYGENSNFSVKFSLIDGKCLSDAQAWSDFKISQETIEKYQNRSVTDESD